MCLRGDIRKSSQSLIFQMFRATTYRAYDLTELAPSLAVAEASQGRSLCLSG